MGVQSVDHVIVLVIQEVQLPIQDLPQAGVGDVLLEQLEGVDAVDGTAQHFVHFHGFVGAIRCSLLLIQGGSSFGNEVVISTRPYFVPPNPSIYIWGNAKMFREVQAAKGKDKMITKGVWRCKAGKGERR